MKAARRTAVRNAVDKPGISQSSLRLLGALTVTNGVIRVALERDVRKGSRHPHVERIMQKQVRQDGTYDPSLRSSRHAWHDAAIFQLDRPELLDILVPKESARFFELPCFHAKLNEKVNSSSAIKF